jgi:hypothetical protein
LYRSTLPQDKIYAALGIAKSLTIQNKRGGAGAQETDITQGFPAIDYTKSPSEVYQDFVKHTINISQDLMCLGIFEDRSKRGKGLPSWTVDLRTEYQRFIIEWPFPRHVEGEKAIIQDFRREGQLIVEGRSIGVTTTMDDTNNPWRDGYPRPFTGRNPPRLRSCFEAQLIGSRDSKKSLDWGTEDIFNRIQSECRHKWMKMDPRGRGIEMLIDSVGNSSLPEENPDFGHMAGPYILTSPLVEDGDEVVRLYGSVDLCVLRRTEDEKADTWEFLGPACLVAAYYENEKVERNGQDQELWEAPPLHNGPGRVRDEKKLPVETFVLV